MTTIETVQQEIADLTAKIANDEAIRKQSSAMSIMDKRILKQKEQQLKLLTALQS